MARKSEMTPKRPLAAAVRRGVITAWILLLGAAFVSIGTAHADEWHGDHRPPGHEDHRDRHREDRRDWHRDYRAPPVVYGGAYGGYAAYPPPVVYGPSIGISLPGINIGIR